MRESSTATSMTTATSEAASGKLLYLESSRLCRERHPNEYVSKPRHARPLHRPPPTTTTTTTTAAQSVIEICTEHGGGASTSAMIDGDGELFDAVLHLSVRGSAQSLAQLFVRGVNVNQHVQCTSAQLMFDKPLARKLSTSSTSTSRLGGTLARRGRRSVPPVDGHHDDDDAHRWPRRLRHALNTCMPCCVRAPDNRRRSRTENSRRTRAMESSTRSYYGGSYRKENKEKLIDV